MWENFGKNCEKISIKISEKNKFWENFEKKCRKKL